MTQLTREQISDIDACCTGSAARERYVTEAEAAGLCAMALALLDVDELVPGEGDVVERVCLLRDVNHNLADYGEAYHEAELREAGLRAKLAALADAAERYERSSTYHMGSPGAHTMLVDAIASTRALVGGEK